MRRTDLKESSSVFFINKWIVIIFVIIISSLSFILGFFVGKSFQPPVINKTSVIHPQESIEEQKKIEPEKKEPVAQQPEQTQKPQETQQTKLTKETKETGNTQETTKTTKYTVQVGAFKNVSDAKALKATLDKKGYKTHIISLEIKTHEKIYKVVIGEFVTKKEADLMSIKLRKSEGLHTFIITKSEQEDLR